MKKIKIGTSFIFLIIICIVLGKISLLMNYLFALTFHELAHLFVATKCGYKLKMIKFDIFGISANLEERIDDVDNFAINIAGPAMNLLLCVVCLIIYSFIPNSYQVLNLFCASNFVLAIFNLLPIYPLDGGKIFKNMVKNKKTYKICDMIFHIVLSVLFLVFFVLSINRHTNWFLLIMGIFFLIPYRQNEVDFGFIKLNKQKNFQKINLKMVSKDSDLISIIKQINQTSYTIFYVREGKQKYVDEDDMIEFALHYPLNTKIAQILDR